MKHILHASFIQLSNPGNIPSFWTHSHILLTKSCITGSLIKRSTDEDERGESAVTSLGDVRAWWRWFEPGWGREPSGWQTATSTGGYWTRKTTKKNRSRSSINRLKELLKLLIKKPITNTSFRELLYKTGSHWRISIFLYW